MWDFDEFITLSNDPRVHVTNFDQCTLGKETTKPTRIMLYKIDLSELTSRCNPPLKHGTSRTPAATQSEFGNLTHH